MQVVGAGGERQVEEEEVVGEMRRALVARRREGRDLGGEEGRGGVRQWCLALVHGARFYPIGA